MTQRKSADVAPLFIPVASFPDLSPPKRHPPKSLPVSPVPEFDLPDLPSFPASPVCELPISGDPPAIDFRFSMEGEEHIVFDFAT